MVKEVEGKFRLSDGTELYEKVWETEGPPTAHLIFLHGFSDHINAYYNLFPTLAAAPYNITVHGIDQRGWGRSCTKSTRGLTGTTDQVIQDVSEYVTHVASQINSTASSPSPPLFLMGHSMGGGEALYYMLSRRSDSPTIAGLILESPFIDFHPSAAPSSIVVTLGRFASRLRPRMQLKQELDASVMSRDPTVVKAWVADELCHDTGTLEGLAGLLSRTGELAGLAKGSADAQGLLKSGKVHVGAPVLWLHGTGDGICHFDASKALYERVLSDADSEAVKRSSDAHWYDGAYHKLHAEPDGLGEQFAKDVGEWVSGVVRHAASGSVADDDAVKSRL